MDDVALYAEPVASWTDVHVVGGQRMLAQSAVSAGLPGRRCICQASLDFGFPASPHEGVDGKQHMFDFLTLGHKPAPGWLVKRTAREIRTADGPHAGLRVKVPDNIFIRHLNSDSRIAAVILQVKTAFAFQQASHPSADKVVHVPEFIGKLHPLIGKDTQEI